MSRIAFVLLTALLLVTQPAGASHLRPKGTSPLKTSFVPAYEQCSAPDRMHGPPLSFPSCSSPQQDSPRLTTGNPPAQAAGLVGRWTIRVKPGVPGPPDDSGAPIDISITDVRCVAASGGCAAPGADYAGHLELRIAVRISDHDNAVAPGGGPDAATMQDIDFSFPIGCAVTADPAIGATCASRTDLLYPYPGFPKDTKRLVMEFWHVRVLDGGADGDASTDDGAATFLTQGVFIP